VDVRALAPLLERRLRALVRAPAVATQVRALDAAPERIECDALLLHRALDLLLASAARHTEAGRMEVELGGSAAELSVRVKGESPGLDPSELARLLDPSGMRRGVSPPSAWGVGIGTAVQIVGRLGGRLEGETGPGGGFALTAFVPCSSPAAPAD
jgi:signal transduction histidine kinase